MPFKHYVNIDPGDPVRREGADVPLRVSRQLWTSTWERISTNRQSRRLEWEVVPDGGNVAADVGIVPSQAAIDSRTAMRGRDVLYALPATKAARPVAARFAQRVTAEEADGHFLNTLTLPHTGGDQFTVRAHKLDSDQARTGTTVEVREIETWRRVYYDFYCANDDCRQLYARIKDRLAAYYAPAFIELIENRTGDAPDAPVTLSTLNQLMQGKAALDHAPNHLRMALVDQWGKEVAVRLDVAVVAAETGAQQAATCTVEHDLGTDTWRFRVRLQQRSVFPADNWLTAFAVTQQQPDTSYLPIAPGLAEVGPSFAEARVADNEVLVTVASAQINGVLTAAASPCRVDLRLKYNQLLGGSSGGKNIAITRRALFDPDGSDEGDKGVMIAFLHEIGHSIGMVDVVSPNYYFDDNGGRGPHCFTAADRVPLDTDRWNEIPRDQTITGRVYLPDVGGVGQCVMYHSRWTGMHASVFCPACVTAMKKMRISVRQ